MQVLEVKPFREAPADGSCTYKYEGRLLRIIIQERLCPLTTLTDMKDIAQVLLDNACDAYSLLRHTYAGSVHMVVWEWTSISRHGWSPARFIFRADRSSP